jgi:diazepam-binding inhibitor (GABA receptor modulating acyl-CoA-binding protein)
MQEEDLEKEFERYCKIGNNMPPQTADNMLVAYAFFKQALEGDNTNERPNESSNVIQTFKHDSWKRLAGMPQQEAKKKYIEKIKELLKLTEEENRLPRKFKNLK